MKALGLLDFGSTKTEADGTFAMAVNGGGYVTIDLSKVGVLPSQRSVKVPWLDYATMPDVVLVALDPKVTKIDLPIPVQIDLGQVGGPSAGLAFALDIVEELGHDVDRGHKVAATGEICADGTVAAVGGLKQKTIGARRAGMDVFLVPAGENTREAERYAGDMRVIPVDSFRQALRELATLPRKQPKA